MPVFITAVTDPFQELNAAGASAPGQADVRRPFRGIQIKPDSYAVLRVVRADGTDIPLLDSGSAPLEEELTGGGSNIGRSTTFSNFIVQSFQDQRMEKQQIIQTFGEDYIFFFGEQPRFVNIAGLLINTKDFDWKNEFLENYERYLRGTRLVENNARMYLYIDDVVMEGYLVNSSVNLTADQPYLVQFSFQMFVCQYMTLSNTGSIYFQQGAQPEAPVSPPDTSALKAAATKTSVQQSSSGGLNAFLADAKKFAQDASISVQKILEEIRNTLYGTPVVAPDGLGSAIKAPLITNQASFSPPRYNRPIYTQRDEFVSYDSTANASTSKAALNRLLDATEAERVSNELALQSPEQLEKRARLQFEKAGIDTSRRETTFLLLGRGAFAAAQYAAAFGIREADGAISNPVSALQQL